MAKPRYTKRERRFMEQIEQLRVALFRMQEQRDNPTGKLKELRDHLRLVGTRRDALQAELQTMTAERDRLAAPLATAKTPKKPLRLGGLTIREWRAHAEETQRERARLEGVISKQAEELRTVTNARDQLQHDVRALTAVLEIHQSYHAILEMMARAAKEKLGG